MTTLTSRAAGLAGAALLICGLLLTLLHAFPPRMTAAIDAAGIQPREGFSYVAALPGGYLARAADLFGSGPDTNTAPSRSRLILNEQGKAIGPAHSLHIDIAKGGRGKYSHWGDGLIFSASDNSDPRTNGRLYTVERELALPLWLGIGLVLAGACLTFWRFAGAPHRPASGRVRAAAIAAALMLFVAAAIATFFYCLPAWEEVELDTQALNHRDGHAYAFTLTGPGPRRLLRILFDAEPDSMVSPTASRLELLENGKPIGSPHSMHADIASRGEGRYSHWGNALIFSTPDNSNPASNGRRYSARYLKAPPSALPLALLAAGLALLALVSRERFRTLWELAVRHRARVFWLAFAVMVLHTNFVFARLLPAAVPWPDSDGYLDWWLFRTLGYPALLHLQAWLFSTWDYLALVQVNLLLAGVGVLAFAIARVSGSYLAAWLMVVGVYAAGSMMLSAADVMTEAAFSAFVMLHAGFVALFFAQRRALTAFAAGLSLAAAILLKSVSVVLVGPLVLAVAFLPGARRALASLVLVPALAAWLAPSAYNLARNGFFESSIAGGYALAGHIAWAIHPRPGSAHPEAAAALEKRLAPLLAKRPAAFKDLDHYIDHTLHEYNPMLWGTITPEMTQVLQSCRTGKDDTWDVCKWTKGCTSTCKLEMNRVLFTISRETIAAEPLRFAYHVVAHKYGMWRHVFAGGERVPTGVGRRAEVLAQAYPAGSRGHQVLGLPRIAPAAQREAARAAVETWPATRLIELATMPDPVRKYALNAIDYLAPLVIVIGLAASALVFTLRRWTPAGQAFCYFALCLNAYFLGHALAQPMLVRYAWTMQGLILAMLLAGVAFALELARRRGRAPAPAGVTPATAPQS